MPSSPPSLLPFGTTLFNNGKYILGVLTNMLSGGKLSKSLSKPALSGNIPLDIGLLPSADTPNAANDASLEGALQKTAETVASSVQAILGAGPRSRVLIFGSESYTRAKCLSETTFAGKPLVLLQDTLVNVVSSKRQGRDGIYWSDDADVLPLCQANFFDVIICFNIANGRDDVSALLKKLDRVLRPGGCLAGTGVFKGPFASEDEGDGDQMTLKSFRDAVEDVGFFMHVSTDLSLEGNVILKVSDDLRGVKDASPVDMVRSGQLLCARFLSTKNNKTGAYRMPQRVSAVIKPKQRKQSREAKFREIESLDDGIYGKTVEELQRVERKIREREALWELKSSSVAPTLPGLGLEGSSSSSRRRADSSVGKEMKGSSDWLGIGAAASAAADAIEQEKSLASQVTGVVITGVSLGLPNQMHPDRPVFDPKNFGSIFRGENFISQLESADKQEMLSMNIVQVSKKEGKRVETTLSKESEVLGVASRMASFDLAKEYGVPPVVVEALDTTYQLAIAAGIEALRDAGIKLSKPETLAGGRTTVMGLPPTMQDETGVIFASSFPSLDSAVEEVSKYAANKARMEILSELKQQLQEQGKTGESGEGYQYNRKLLFKLLVMANSQLAELINARGPNTHINSACSGTTQAIALAEDWIRAGRCKRVIVVGADNPTTSNLFKFIGTGFLALGAATTSHKVEDAAIPFDKRRKGMILGAGAVGLVVEATSAALARNAAIKSEILGSAILNSAFHACLMDGQHIASEFRRFIEKMAKEHGLDRTELAKDCIYFSHETGTSANGGCAKVEVDALAAAFGEKSKPDILIANTKGFTGHPMAVGVEDVVAVASLAQGLVPPVANLQTVDPCLGDIQLARGGTHSRNYALRFAAGFGSQFTMLLMRKWESQKSRARALSLARASPVLRHRQAARRPSPPHISIPIVVRVSGNTAISSSSAKLSPAEGLEDAALSPEPLSRELSGLKLS